MHSYLFKTDSHFYIFYKATSFSNVSFQRGKSELKFCLYKTIHDCHTLFKYFKDGSMADIRIAIVKDNRKVTGSQRTRLNYVKNTQAPSRRITNRQQQQPLVDMDSEEDDSESASPRKTGNIVRIVTWINLCLVLMLIIFIAIYVATEPAHIVKRVPKTIDSSFTLLPDKDSAGKYMTISLERNAVNLKEIPNFQVCCTLDNMFMCGYATNHIGVTAVLTSEKMAIIHLQSDKMIGAICKLYFK